MAGSGISLAPFLFVLQGVLHGRYSDHHASRREQRFIPLLFGIGCMSLTIALLAASLLITRYWKISLHLVGIAGSITVLVLLFGPGCLWLSLLVALVGWARWRVRARTPLQVLAGMALAVSVAALLFWLFGLA